MSALTTYSERGFDNPRRPIVQGAIVFAVFFVLFGSWLMFAPISGAIVGGATLRVESHRQAVQHVDGGIVREVRVREGDLVAEQAVLLKLDDGALKANVAVLSAQEDTLRAQEARLLAERDGQRDMVAPPSLFERQSEPQVAQVIEAQKALLYSRRQALESQISVHRKRIAQQIEQIRSYGAQLRAAEQQFQIANDERAGLAQLLEKGFVARTRVLSLDREIAALDGRAGDTRAQIARAKQQMAESDAEMERLTRERASEVAQALRDVQSSLRETSPRLTATREALARVDLRAPRAGYVVGLTVFNPGAVIRAGDRVLDIVPIDSPLVVETHVRPEDVDDVRLGMKADVRLTGLNTRITPSVAGDTISVSADRMTDPRTGESYFEVLVRLDEHASAPYRDKLVSGMPALTMFPTGDRTPLNYLLKPLLDGYDRSLRE